MEPPSPVSVFYSAQLRLLRAEEHLNDLEAQIRAFFAEQPHTIVAEPDPDGAHEIYKLKFTKRFPFRWRILATEIIEHARSSLDHAAFACHLAARGDPNCRYVSFPFGKTPNDFETAIKGRSKDLTTEIKARLRLFNCYEGGNDLLYALNNLANLSKHALIAFVAGSTLDFQITGGAGPFSLVGIQMNNAIRWDAAKNEIVYARAKKGSHFEHQIKFTAFVAIQEKELTSAEPAVDILRAMLGEVCAVTTGLDAECTRLGYAVRG
jgi:hypothetical protein